MIFQDDQISLWPLHLAFSQPRTSFLSFSFYPASSHPYFLIPLLMDLHSSFHIQLRHHILWKASPPTFPPCSPCHNSRKPLSLNHPVFSWSNHACLPPESANLEPTSVFEPIAYRRQPLTVDGKSYWKEKFCLLLVSHLTMSLAKVTSIPDLLQPLSLTCLPTVSSKPVVHLTVYPNKSSPQMSCLLKCFN